MADTDWRDNISAGGSWLRLLYMLAYLLILWVCSIVAGVVILIQAVMLLLTRSPLNGLVEFGENLVGYMLAVARYLLFLDEERPFPFNPADDAGELEEGLDDEDREDDSGSR